MSAASNVVVMLPPVTNAAALAVDEALTEGAVLALYGEEEYIQVLTATLDAVPPVQQEELVAALSGVLAAQVDKRDRVAQCLRALDNQISFGESEIARLRARVGAFETIRTRMEGLLTEVLRKLGRDPADKKGRRWLKLDGKTSTLGLKNLPDGVEFDDVAALPRRYQRNVVTLSADLWDRVVDALPMELASEVTTTARVKVDEPPKTPIKEAIEAREIVPGAHLATDRVKLVRL